MGMTFTLAGATGRLRPLPPLLLARGHRVRLVTREVTSPAAQELRGLGAEIVRGDFNDPDSLVAALRGADAFFAAGTAHRVGPDGELRHGIAAAEAANEAGVDHFVYLSGSGAANETGVPVFDAKHAVENHIRSLKLPYTIVAPVYFMENLFNPWNLAALGALIFPSPVSPERDLQQVAVNDVAAFTSTVLERPAEFLGERVEIASDELTASEAARTISQVVGRHFDVQVVDTEGLPGGLARLFGWLEHAGDHVDIAALHADHPEVGWLSFEGWARAQDWRQLTRAGVSS
jgi:uncharacterized protein YbjT (DUF2867 family)